MTHPDGRGPRRAARRGAVAAATAAAGLVLSPIARAQDLPPGGIQLSFGISEQLEASDNRALDVDSAGTTITSQTGFTAALTSETRDDSLALNASAVLRAADGPGDPETGFADPQVSLSYDRTGPGSAFSANAAIAASDIGYLRPLDDFLTDEGTIVLPDDLDDLEGEGTRIARNVSLQLDLGQDGPLRTGLGLAVSDVGYRDATSPGLVDSQRVEADVGFGFTLNPVFGATLGFGYVRVDEAGEDLRETRSLDAGLSYARPLGDLSLTLSLDEADEGRRTGLRFGRSLALPSGRIGFGLGATRAAEGDISATGDISVVRELPDGALTLAGNRAISTTDDGERLRTALSVDYSRVLTPLAGLSLDANWFRDEDTGSGAATEEASLGASVGYQFTPVWSVNVGYRYRQRDEPASDTARENSVFLSVGRGFSFRP